MIGLTWIPEAIRAFVWVYIVITIILLLMAIFVPKTILGRIVSCVIVAVMCIFFPYKALIQNGGQEDAALVEKKQKLKERLLKSSQLFEEQCKTAGETIEKTVDGIEGVVLMRWRSREQNDSDQFKLDDPFGRDCYEEGCIVDLLKSSFTPDGQEVSAGYKYVETIDPADGIRYRYTGKYKELTDDTRPEFTRHVHNTGYAFDKNGKFFALSREPIKKYSAHYGVNWQDISSHVDRENWIAGGLLEIVDLQSNEIIGKRIGYIQDVGLGSTSNFRLAWEMAQTNACPKKVDELGKSTRVGFTRRFVQKVLIPK